MMLDVEVGRNQTPDAPTEDMVWIPGGTFRMGSDHHYIVAYLSVYEKKD